MVEASLLVHYLVQRLIIPFRVETGGFQSLGELTDYIKSIVYLTRWTEHMDLVKNALIRTYQ